MVIPIRFYLLPLLLLTLPACKEKAASIKPIVSSITESVYASGVVKPDGQYKVYANTGGVVKSILVNEGDIVKKGQIIATLSNDALIANSRTSGITANFNDVKNNQSKITEAEHNVEIAKLKMENDAMLLVRQRNLWQQDIGTKVELDNRILSAKNSKAGYENALLQLQNLKKQLQYNASQSASNQQAASALAADLSVRSKVNGKVFTLIKKQGEMITAQTPLAVIGDDASFFIELQIDENDITRIQPNLRVFITMDSYKDKVFEAKITRLIPYMNEQTRTFTVEAHFAKPPPALYPNLTAEASILISKKDNALLIPTDYLMNDNFVQLKNGKRKKVVTGVKDYRQIEIISGLAPNDEILKPQL